MQLFIKKVLGAAVFATALTVAVVWIPNTFFEDEIYKILDYVFATYWLPPFIFAIIIGAFSTLSFKKTVLISLFLYVITFFISITFCQPSEGCGGLEWNIKHQGGILILSSLLYLLPAATAGGVVGAVLRRYLLKRSSQ